ncbi:MAPKK kinase [Acrasis kona]|uniref:MAPKK kinase n=1 Tax=Acrasis kona TaxID=1008807 RepID=A0AAW2ZE62_9EUKA
MNLPLFLLLFASALLALEQPLWDFSDKVPDDEPFLTIDLFQLDDREATTQLNPTLRFIPGAVYDGDRKYIYFGHGKDETGTFDNYISTHFMAINATSKKMVKLFKFQGSFDKCIPLKLSAQSFICHICMNSKGITRIDIENPLERKMWETGAIINMVVDHSDLKLYVVHHNEDSSKTFITSLNLDLKVIHSYELRNVLNPQIRVPSKQTPFLVLVTGTENGVKVWYFDFELNLKMSKILIEDPLRLPTLNHGQSIFLASEKELIFTSKRTEESLKQTRLYYTKFSIENQELIEDVATLQVDDDSYSQHQLTTHILKNNVLYTYFPAGEASYTLQTQLLQAPLNPKSQSNHCPADTLFIQVLQDDQSWCFTKRQLYIPSLKAKPFLDLSTYNRQPIDKLLFGLYCGTVGSTITLLFGSVDGRIVRSQINLVDRTSSLTILQIQSDSNQIMSGHMHGDQAFLFSTMGDHAHSMLYQVDVYSMIITHRTIIPIDYITDFVQQGDIIYGVSQGNSTINIHRINTINHDISTYKLQIDSPINGGLSKGVGLYHYQSNIYFVTQHEIYTINIDAERPVLNHTFEFTKTIRTASLYHSDLYLGIDNVIVSKYNVMDHQIKQIHDLWDYITQSDVFTSESINVRDGYLYLITDKKFAFRINLKTEQVNTYTLHVFAIISVLDQPDEVVIFSCTDGNLDIRNITLDSIQPVDPQSHPLEWYLMVIIPSSVLGLTLTFLIIVLIVFLIRQHASLNHEKNEMRQRILNKSSHSAAMVGEMIDIENLSFEKSLGEGAGGIVYKGTWNSIHVAIKKIKDQEQKQKFLSEASILSYLRHPNIILFLGIAVDQDNQYIITEYAENGSLDDLIYEKHQNKYKSIPLMHKFNMLIDVCKGMIYLHSLNPQILHHDLKPSNVLVDRNMNVKLSDFGSSHAMSHDRRATSSYGTIQYTCPTQLMQSGPFVDKCDVYSFAICMYELLFVSKPYKSNNKRSAKIARQQSMTSPPCGADAVALVVDEKSSLIANDAMAVVVVEEEEDSLFALGLDVINGRRPYVPFDVRDDGLENKILISEWCKQLHGFEHEDVNVVFDLILKYVLLMERCWSADVDQRPTFLELLTALQEFCK